MRPPKVERMTFQTGSMNRTQQGGVVAGSAAVMFTVAATTDGLFSGVMFVTAMGTILSGLALYAAAYWGSRN